MLRSIYKIVYVGILGLTIGTLQDFSGLFYLISVFDTQIMHFLINSTVFNSNLFVIACLRVFLSNLPLKFFSISLKVRIFIHETP